jgi:hypothetical protein
MKFHLTYAGIHVCIDSAGRRLSPAAFLSHVNQAAHNRICQQELSRQGLALNQDILIGPKSTTIEVIFH